MSSVLVCGSLAYDVLYTFPGVFSIDQAAQISVAFNVYNKAVHFGGCAGNIVYNGKLLNEDFILFGMAGKDFFEYKGSLGAKGIDTSHVIIRDDDFTSQATVVTDQKAQQITFFYEGAVSHAYEHRSEIMAFIERTGRSHHLKLAHIAPNSRDFMLAAIDACMKIGLPFIFDPGQAMPLFSKDEMKKFLGFAAVFFVNEYESALAAKMLDISPARLITQTNLLVVTEGKKGSNIYWHSKKIHIPAQRPKMIKDPTGCGDAYRAGFLSKIAPAYPNLTESVLRKAGNIGTKLATRCLQSFGTQNH